MADQIVMNMNMNATEDEIANVLDCLPHDGTGLRVLASEYIAQVKDSVRMIEEYESLQSQLGATLAALNYMRNYSKKTTERLAAANERADGLQKIVDAARAQKPVAWAYRFSVTERHDDVHDDDAYFEVVYRTRRELSPDDPFGRRGRDFDDAADTTETALYSAPVPAQPAFVAPGPITGVWIDEQSSAEGDKP